MYTTCANCINSAYKQLLQKPKLYDKYILVVTSNLS